MNPATSSVAKFADDVTAFSAYTLNHGLIADLRMDEFPSMLWGWSYKTLELPAGSTHLGFVYAGSARIESDAGSFTAKSGMYFALPGHAKISGASQGIVISRLEYNGIFQLGGPVEEKGRLKYIDGCTDSLLIPPVLKGDACLNLLCFPPHIDQTAHTHPSMRLGIVVSGKGICRIKEGDIALTPGKVFIIHANQSHAFATQDGSMRVIAYHPDSDFGATDQFHPMINRTIVEGVSASLLDNIRTK